MRSIAPHSALRGKLPRALVAGAIAVALLAGSVAPSFARGGALSDLRAADETQTSSSTFRDHFDRGMPRSGYDGTYGGVALSGGLAGAAVGAATEVRILDAEAYCSDRFKSYDPSSGTYLGYDGNEHACP